MRERTRKRGGGNGDLSPVSSSLYSRRGKKRKGRSPVARPVQAAASSPFMLARPALPPSYENSVCLKREGKKKKEGRRRPQKESSSRLGPKEKEREESGQAFFFL